MEDQVFIGRQPILDVKENIIGYELFFRHSAEAKTAIFEDDFKACSSVLVNTMNDTDTQWLIRNKLAFINVSESMLMSEFIELMPPHRTVLEILKSVTATDAVIARCQDLHNLGFKIALDNPHSNAALQPLSKYADYIKIDTQSTSLLEAEKIFHHYQYHAPSIKIVAEKIETHAQFSAYKKIGFQRFQGFFFALPETISTKTINPSFDSVLLLLDMVSKDEDSTKIEAVFKRDVTLSFKLLHHINSIGFGLSCEIQSIKHALTILGNKQLYRWLTLLMVTADDNTTPLVLTKTSIIRGHLTELLGEGYFDKIGRDNLFIVGVFSLLDAILRIPMEEILANIQLPETVTQALLTRDGIYGPFLQLVEAYERADNHRISELVELLQLNAGKVNQCYMAALTWAETLGAETNYQ